MAIKAIMTMIRMMQMMMQFRTFDALPSLSLFYAPHGRPTFPAVNICLAVCSASLHSFLLPSLPPLFPTMPHRRLFSFFPSSIILCHLAFFFPFPSIQITLPSLLTLLILLILFFSLSFLPSFLIPSCPCSTGSLFYPTSLSLKFPLSSSLHSSFLTFPSSSLLSLLPCLPFPIVRPQIDVPLRQVPTSGPSRAISRSESRSS